MKQYNVRYGKKSDGSDARKGVLFRPNKQPLSIVDSESPKIQFTIGWWRKNQNARSSAEWHMTSAKGSRAVEKKRRAFYVWNDGEREFGTSE